MVQSNVFLGKDPRKHASSTKVMRTSSLGRRGFIGGETGSPVGPRPQTAPDGPIRISGGNRLDGAWSGHQERVNELDQV